MSYVHHVEQFHGLPAFTFPPYADPVDLPDPDAVAWRLHCGPYPTDEKSSSCLRRFTESVDLGRIRALIIGSPWYDDQGGSGIGEVIALSSRLTSLEAVFLGDLEDEEAMISMIGLEDLTELLEAFPGLKELGVRGGDGLDFPVTGHAGLRVLRVESGGLPSEAAAHIAAASLPSLERLDLWLGDEEYGGGTTAEDLAPLLNGVGKPALRHLGLQNSTIQDELAAALASAPVVRRLTSLSLSMGTLGDEGAEALLSGQSLAHLRELDLSHHYLSQDMMLRLWTELEPHGVRVDLTARQEEEDNVYVEEGEPLRYIAVSE
ncbi:STM4015 family protein [Streptomyces sp. NBC_00059]|uniref:STM4015 family protein n=1 Tax=Streptomyces sp. NBC_00059 TaxID=2975635 RepID=UPI0022562962|nr:STM4015 family protein [Streptomyces sp. NBC_00059]MCX5412521.1 STM4015 family protein [Streptomyces sp. NBC_00059]